VPTEPRYLLALLWLRARQSPNLRLTGEIRSLLSRLSRVARSATQLVVMADVYRQLGDLDRALDFARRAVEASPGAPVILDAYAALLFERGEIDEALRVQRAAVSFLSETTHAPRIIQHLRVYEARSRGASHQVVRKRKTQ
jgi:tetratricopeptide (TPR) repeat protein